MSNISKTLVIVGIIILTIFLISILAITEDPTGKTHHTSIFDYLVIIGAIASVRAVWKYNPQKSNLPKKLNDDDSNKLDKN